MMRRWGQGIEEAGPMLARLAAGAALVAKAAGFAPDRPVIEVRGRCGECEGD